LGRAAIALNSNPVSVPASGFAQQLRLRPRKSAFAAPRHGSGNPGPNSEPARRIADQFDKVPDRRCCVFIQEMTVAECREALATASFGRLACARENQPYVVPVYFAVDRDGIYSFSMPGQKIEWMRNNPRVCLGIDHVKRPNDWTCMVVLGQYEELPDTPDYRLERLHALGLLRSRAMWWQPGSVAVANRGDRRDVVPVFYRINIEHLTGRRGVPAPDEMAAGIPGDEKGG
jgi:uncharacterized protein